MFFSSGGMGGGFPFPGMDGDMPGGGRRRKSNKPVDTQKFYDLLEVDKNVNSADLKKAYRKLAVKHHPDKGGDPEMFKQITKAYETLSDPEKKATYDKHGEEGLEEGGGGGGDPTDIFDAFFGGGGGRGGGGGKKKKQRTKDVTNPISVTLEQIYNGETKKMALTRKVIDKQRGVQTCEECDGRGMKVQVIRMGPMVQQTQSACRACGGQGKSFKLKSQREVLEVHIQKGAPEGHKINFRDMADEHPDADPGDVIFVVKVKEHALFKRKGADLYIEKDIRLVEALCGFSMELTHLDGRKLLIETTPGDIVKPMAKGFDPLAPEVENAMEWQEIADMDCPGVENVASAETTDIDTLKKACETQLKRKGIDVGAFVIKNGSAYFKQGTREEIMAGAKKCPGATMYVVDDPNRKAGMRMMKAVKGEGMPTYKNPFVHGNLFLILNIEFPESLTAEMQAGLRKHLPPPVNVPMTNRDDPDVELHEIVEMDPVESYNSNRALMGDMKDATEEDEESGGGPGGQRVQCAQQ